MHSRSARVMPLLVATACAVVSCATAPPTSRSSAGPADQAVAPADVAPAAQPAGPTGVPPAAQSMSSPAEPFIPRPDGAAAGTTTLRPPAADVGEPPPASAAAPKPGSDKPAYQWPAAASGRTPDLGLGDPEPALTEALNKALEKLEDAKTENERLLLENGKLRDVLADKDRQIAAMQGDIDACQTRIQGLEGALEAWKRDVLGFREEMRDYEEAEMQVLQEMVLLLRAFKTQKQAEENGGRP